MPLPLPPPPRHLTERPSPWRMAELEERVHAAENHLREQALRRADTTATPAKGPATKPGRPA